MSLAADVYFELSIRGLAPSVPFVAAPDVWREPLLKAIGDADDLCADITEAYRAESRAKEDADSAREMLADALEQLKFANERIAELEKLKP